MVQVDGFSLDAQKDRLRKYADYQEIPLLKERCRRYHDRGANRYYHRHCAGLLPERSIPGHGLDERPHVRGLPGAEAGPEWHQLVRKCDERCHFSEMAIPMKKGGR